MPPKPGGGIKRKDTLSTLMANEPDDLSQLLSLDEDSVRDALHARVPRFARAASRTKRATRVTRAKKSF